jgi:alpha-amylase
VLTRRREAYHDRIAAASTQTAGEHDSIHNRVLVKEADLEKKLITDHHRRAVFNTYFCNQLDPEDYVQVETPGASPPQPQHADYCRPCQRIAVEDATISGEVDFDDFSLRKTIALSLNSLDLQIVKSSGELPGDQGLLVAEFNLTVLTDKSRDRWLEIDGVRFSIADPGRWDNPGSIQLVDGWQEKRISLESVDVKSVTYYPVYTVSSSEGGFERTYQGSCIMLAFEPERLNAGIKVNLAIKEL